MTENKKRQLSVREALEACFIVVDKNCGKEALIKFQKDVLLEHADRTQFFMEWHAFVFAAVYYGFSRFAPAYMVLEYVRSIKYFLQETGYGQAEISEFLDNRFQAYIKLIIEENVKECPKLFFRRLLGKEIQDVDRRSVMVLSGAMAMLAAACLDIFEKYEYGID